MNCLAVTEKLSRYIENALSASDTRAVSEHCEKCGNCKDALQQVSRLQEVFNNSEVAEMPDKVTNGLYRVISEYRFNKNEPRQTMLSWFTHAPIYVRLAFLCFTLLSGLTGTLMSYDLWMTPSDSGVKTSLEPIDKVYQLDAFGSRSEGSLYDMFRDIVFAEDGQAHP